MQDMIDVLRTLPHAVTPGPAGAEVVAADVARGHRALIRQRRRRIAHSGIVAAAAAVLVGATQLAQVGGPRQPAADGSNATTQQASRVQLVDFTGTQPVGFKVSTVPAGWQVISSDKTTFVVAPPGSDASAAGPQRGAAGGPGVGFVGSFVGRIAVMLQGASRLPSDSPVTKVSINGKDGLLGHARDGHAPDANGRPSKGAAMGAVLWLIFPDAAGNKVLVQVPTSLGLTNDQIVRFAQGITVTSDAHSLGG
jgi:hypothetical protein